MQLGTEALQERGYCISCGYPLRGLDSSRCPECGRLFDPLDPRTMRFGVATAPFARALELGYLVLGLLIMGAPGYILADHGHKIAGAGFLLFFTAPLFIINCWAMHKITGTSRKIIVMLAGLLYLAWNVLIFVYVCGLKDAQAPILLVVAPFYALPPLLIIWTVVWVWPGWARWWGGKRESGGVRPG